MIMRAFYLSLSIMYLMLLSSKSFAQPQYTVYGIQGGYSISAQKWATTSRGPIYKPNFDIIYEKYSPGEGKALYSSLGYHVRGNGETINFFNRNNRNRQRVRLEVQHYNVVFNLGIKGRLVKPSGNAMFYILAARAELNVANDFEIFRGFEDEVNPVVAGVTFTLGYEWLLSSNGTIIAGLSVQPDFTNQIYIQPGTAFIDGMQRNFREEKIKNFSIELSVGYLLYKERYN